MSLQNILIMEAEYKLANTTPSPANYPERKMLRREIKQLDAQLQETENQADLSEVYKLGQFIKDNLR